MLTTTDTWKDAAGRARAFVGAPVVMLADYAAPLGYRYFSTAPLTFADSGITCFPAIAAISDFVQGVNLDSFSVNIQSITIELTALPKEKTPDTYTGSDHLSTDASYHFIHYDEQVFVLLHPGPPVASISDCLLVLKGKVASVEHYGDRAIVRVDEIDYGEGSFKGWLHTVPTTIMTLADYPDLPEEHVGETAPLIYGVMSEKDVDGLPGALQTGFALGNLVKREPTVWTFMIASHACKSVAPTVGRVWVYIPSLDCWAYNKTSVFGPPIITGPTSSRTDLRIDQWYARVPPTSVFHGSQTRSASYPVNAVTDGDMNTSFNVYATTADSAEFYLEFDQKGDSSHDNYNNGTGIFLDDTGYVDMLYTSTAVYTAKWQFYHNGTWLDCTWPGGAYDNEGVFTRFPLDGHTWTGTNGTMWHLGSGTNNGDGSPTKVRLLFARNGGSAWTPDMTIVGVVKQAWLVPPYFWVARTGASLQKPSTAARKAGRRGMLREARWYKAPNPPLPEVATQPLSWTERNAIAQWQPTNFLGFEVEGRTFAGGWNYRNWRSYVPPTYVIEYPGDVVESILRSELGTTNISTWSFDYVCPYDVWHPLTNVAKCYLNMPIGKSMVAKDLCERIGWEHSIFFWRSRGGTFSAADCFGTWDVKATITPQHVKGGRIAWTLERPGVYRPVVNFIHTRLPVNESFNRTTYAEDAGASAGDNVQIPDVELDTLRQSTIDGDADVTYRLKKRLLGDSATGFNGGLWSRAKLHVSIETFGWQFADLEIGDSVKFSSDWDCVQICPLGSKQWSTDTYVVHNTIIKSNSVVVEMINWKGGA